MLERMTELWEQYQRWVILVVVVIGGGVAIFIGSTRLMAPATPEKTLAVGQSVQPTTNKAQAQSVKSDASATVNKRLFVDVKGAVKKPGVLEVPSGARLDSVLALAGGTIKNADLNQVNLAQEVQDQQIIYVPKRGEKMPAQFSSGSVTATSESGGANATGGNVNLNSASKEDLQTLTGVGPSKADAIIQYREENGQFGTIDELTEVTGFGEKTFEKLKDKLSV